MAKKKDQKKAFSCVHGTWLVNSSGVRVPGSNCHLMAQHSEGELKQSILPIRSHNCSPCSGMCSYPTGPVTTGDTTALRAQGDTEEGTRALDPSLAWKIYMNTGHLFNCEEKMIALASPRTLVPVSSVTVHTRHSVSLHPRRVCTKRRHLIG